MKDKVLSFLSHICRLKKGFGNKDPAIHRHSGKSIDIIMQRPYRSELLEHRCLPYTTKIGKAEKLVMD
jgi:hypothetical protein